MKYILIFPLLFLTVYYCLSNNSHQTNKETANEEVETDSKVLLQDKNLQQAFATIVKNKETSENNVNKGDRLPASLNEAKTTEEEASLAFDDFDEIVLNEIPLEAKKNAIANLQEEIKSDEVSIESLRSSQEHEAADVIEEKLDEKKKQLENIQLNYRN